MARCRSRHRYLLFPVLAALLAASCAYFNTFYNARESYEEAAELARLHPDRPSESEAELLRSAIHGCGKVLRYHPESGWADDAQLLMGDALYLLGKRTLRGSGTSSFQEAMRSYSSAIVMTDDREIRDRANLGLGRAAMSLDRHGDAVASLQAVSDRDRRTYTVARVLMLQALIEAGSSDRALQALDTLAVPESDSLRGEILLMTGKALTDLGRPDSAAVLCLEAGGLFERGGGYYEAMTQAAEAYIEAGEPESAAEVLEELLQGHRSSLEMARISLLRGKARTAAGDTTAALSAYLDATESDPSKEVGAEALYLRSRLLEARGRLEDALADLTELSQRPGSYLWIRLSTNRMRDLKLLIDYRDQLGSAEAAEREEIRLRIAEKRQDLYSETDSTAIGILTELSRGDDRRAKAYSLVALAQLPDVDPDSSRELMMRALQLARRSDLATAIEDSLGLERGPDYQNRPSMTLERAWDLIEEESYEEAWRIVDELLSSEWSYDARPELLWAAYVAAEAARKDDSLVEGYLEELVEDYPLTEEGRAAADRLMTGEEGNGE
ncbi:tetratricopeptide repeat protein [Candidatus Fermentibacteria bacterium]|nr:tetratricopeptide repeat protein [Candidatus Fermentibacteria bacterium]